MKAKDKKQNNDCDNTPCIAYIFAKATTRPSRLRSLCGIVACHSYAQIADNSWKNK